MKSKGFIYSLASVHLKRRFILIPNSNHLSLLTFSPSFPPMVIPQTGKAAIRSSRPNTWLSHIMASGCSARWLEEWEARQTHAFRLSSAAYCMLLSCGKAQPRCWSRAKCPWLLCCRCHLPQCAAGWPELSTRLCCSPAVGWDNKSHRIPLMITVCPEVPKNMGYSDKQQHNFIIIEYFPSRKELF